MKGGKCGDHSNKLEDLMKKSKKELQEHARKHRKDKSVKPSKAISLMNKKELAMYIRTKPNKSNTEDKEAIKKSRQSKADKARGERDRSKMKEKYSLTRKEEKPKTTYKVGRPKKDEVRPEKEKAETRARLYETAKEHKAKTGKSHNKPLSQMNKTELKNYLGKGSSPFQKSMDRKALRTAKPRTRPYRRPVKKEEEKVDIVELQKGRARRISKRPSTRGQKKVMRREKFLEKDRKNKRDKFLVRDKLERELQPKFRLSQIVEEEVKRSKNQAKNRLLLRAKQKQQDEAPQSFDDLFESSMRQDTRDAVSKRKDEIADHVDRMTAYGVQGPDDRASLKHYKTLPWLDQMTKDRLSNLSRMYG